MCCVLFQPLLSPCGFPDHGSSKLLPSSSTDPVWGEAQVSFGRQPPPPTPPEEPQPVTRHGAKARHGSVLSSCPEGLCLHLLGTLPDAMPTKWGRGSILSCGLTCCWLCKEQSPAQPSPHSFSCQMRTGGEELQFLEYSHQRHKSAVLQSQGSGARQTCVKSQPHHLIFGKFH